MKNPKQNCKFSKGFTLIELLVVISIIGLLASVVLISLNSARTKARDTKRRADLKQLSTALEMYYSDNGAYPSTFTGTAPGSFSDYRGYCVLTNNNCGGACTTSGATGYIPNLAPTYVSQLPRDPKEDIANNKCYLYNSNGTDYILLAFLSVENCTNIANDPMHRIAYPAECDYAVYTSGAANW